MIECLLVDEERASGMGYPVPPHVLSDVLTRLVESFVYADLIIGEEPEADLAASVITSILGAPPQVATRC
jgi:hypothetical protein